MTEFDDPIVGKIKASASFPVNVECEGYPDVTFNVMFKKTPDTSTVEELVYALEYYVYSYNMVHFLKPIHYISDIDSLPESSSAFSVCVRVDFGNAKRKALIGAVKAICDADLSVYRLVLE